MIIFIAVIPAKAGIQEKKNHWIPHQVRNDGKEKYGADWLYGTGIIGKDPDGVMPALAVVW